jgi:hypothetical protein
LEDPLHLTHQVRVHRIARLDLRDACRIGLSSEPRVRSIVGSIGSREANSIPGTAPGTLP